MASCQNLIVYKEVSCQSGQTPFERVVECHKTTPTVATFKWFQQWLDAVIGFTCCKKHTRDIFYTWKASELIPQRTFSMSLALHYIMGNFNSQHSAHTLTSKNVKYACLSSPLAKQVPELGEPLAVTNWYIETKTDSLKVTDQLKGIKKLTDGRNPSNNDENPSIVKRLMLEVTLR